MLLFAPRKAHPLAENAATIEGRLTRITAMRYSLIVVGLLALGCTSAAMGQEAPPPSPSDVPAFAPPPPAPFFARERPNDPPVIQGNIPGVSPAQMTPEMYLYLHQLQRYEDPKQAVRRKAELKTAQRNQRLAAQKWFGVSNARPMASAQPFMDLYSPRWIGNGYNAFDWRGAEGADVNVLVVEPTTVRR
jgi:hypothetical protein